MVAVPQAVTLKRVKLGVVMKSPVQLTIVMATIVLVFQGKMENPPTTKQEDINQKQVHEPDTTLIGRNWNYSSHWWSYNAFRTE